MATKKTAPTKSDFIRKHSALKAPEVVAKGKEAGLKFAVEYVYAIRQNDKKAAQKKGAHKAPKAAKSGHAPKHVTSGHSGAESTFRRLVVDLGAARARALVADVESKLTALVRGL